MRLMKQFCSPYRGQWHSFRVQIFVFLTGGGVAALLTPGYVL